MSKITKLYPYPVSVLYDDGYSVQEGSFNLNAVLPAQLEITANPSKKSYRAGEIISYSGLEVTVTFSDDTTEIVTDKCVITPAAGKAFDPETDDAVEIIYIEGRNSQSCSFPLTYYYATDLAVTAAPTKTSYKYGEALDYAGLIVTATYSNGSTEDITDLCTITPAAGKTFDPDTDTDAEIRYIEGSSVLTGALHLTAVTLRNISVTSNPAKTSYQSGELISYAGMVITATYSDNTTADVTSECVITPSAGKPFNPASDTHVEIIYREGQDNKSCDLTLTHYYAMSLRITSSPRKTNYKTQERIDYTGLAVTAEYSDGSTADVTNLCTIIPAAGKAFDPATDTTVNISYGNGSSAVSTSMSLNAVILCSIAVTSNPSKTSYTAGEAISYDGLVVTATYSDGSTADVTGLCTITPSAGKAFDPLTDTSVVITYPEQGTNGLITETANLSLTENAGIFLTGISVTSNPSKTGYKAGEAIDYTGLVVTASYSDGSTENVTSSCIISPAAGKAFNPNTDTYAEISYLGSETASIMLTEVYLTGLQVTANPTKTAYKHDERISYAGLVVTASYSDNSSDLVTSRCTIQPADGKKFNAETDSYVEITYAEGLYDASCTLTFTPITLNALHVSTPPNKIAYAAGETISYSGIVVTALYSDNSADNVTAKCIFSPSAGTSFDSQTAVTITYTEGAYEQTCSFTLIEASESSITLIVGTMPTKSSYRQGETLDYSGIVIKAVHADGTQHTVTDYCDFSPADGSTVTTAETSVTVKCAPPATPYVFDLNCGYVDNGVWKYENPTKTYIDIYQVSAGHKYLLTLGSNVGSRFRAMFTTADVSQASANVSGTKIININNPAAYASVEYTPSSNGYIVVGKDNVGKTGVKTYLYDANADASEMTATAEFTLTSPILTSIAATKPVKARFRVGEKYDYAGVIVTANYSDGSIVNVTDDAVFSPAEGTTVTSDNPASMTTSQISVSYTDPAGTSKSTSFELTKGGVAIVSLSVTPPSKTAYWVGDTIDYTGCTVTAVYWDGSTKDVTSEAVFDPPNGLLVGGGDENNNIEVLISYQEIDETLCSNVEIVDDYNSLAHLSREEDYYCDDDEDPYWASYVLYVPKHYIQLQVESISASTGQITTQTFTIDGLSVNLSPRNPKYMTEETFYDYLTRDDYVTIRLDYQTINVSMGGVEDGYYWSTGNFQKKKNYMALRAKQIEGMDIVDGQLGYYEKIFYDVYPVYDEGFEPYTPPPPSIPGTPPATPYMPLIYEYIYDDQEFYCTNPRRKNGGLPSAWCSEHFCGRFVEKRRWIPLLTLYYDSHASTSLNFTAVTLRQNLLLTPPNKTVYHYGETLDYTGLVAIASYSNGDTIDVSSKLTFDPEPGTLMTSSQSISIQFMDEVHYVPGNAHQFAYGKFQVTVLTLSGIDITQPTKTSYLAGEAIDYAGATVTARYSDGSIEDVTSSAVFTPSAGTVISDDLNGSVSVSVSYTNSWSETATGNFSLHIITDSE